MAGRLLPDTNAFIALLRGKPAVAETLDSASEVLLSAVVLGELTYGAMNSRSAESNLRKLEDLRREALGAGAAGTPRGALRILDDASIVGKRSAIPLMHGSLKREVTRRRRGRRLSGRGHRATFSRMTLQELESQLAALSRAEKAEVLQRLARDLGNAWSGIERTPGVAGGTACVVRTRIPVWAIENYRRLGWSEGRILENHPTLRAADLVNAWAYVDAHRDEIDDAIRENEGA